ncbi:glycoside hydrolase family 32 protein [Rubellicoccus peritrichatus]|uniref:Glycoside hydrolase family 32 protein n=1 Tax=Rubellicoccus peritrichatus TaxID=3080537 RepID=A0AAQ3L9S9_9BACT|nr:glycoside hydrolase family 32 protein [Puniceicoccus sp. CR14]WOO41471.1 glycoside hydrolase family 32 protein [Puniceicoccus sp. CR14]
MQNDNNPDGAKSPWNIGALGAPPYDPFSTPSDYKEDFRPQFHFSPKNEWMNDINALIYHDGTYHMLYQWGRNARHGGYATSQDLVHWDDRGVALVPQDTFLPKDAVRNASGKEVYSGSGVFVEGEAAKKITGSPEPALVAIYTGTKVGTCIAWSNDDGKTWNNYENNPVANATEGVDPRDPCVIWYEREQKWVMAIYENGTTFYGSRDLIQWERLSNIHFGFECPDLVELPLDGDGDRMKWVLYDANGSYLVGNFDGTSFTDENKAEPLMMDCGPDFYAAQTFFPHNLPEKKYIQIAWNDHWNGGVGEEKWERNATFPVELGLVTRDSKMCVTRTPIDEIKKLYVGDPIRKSNIELGSENILTGVKSKAFDMTLVIDLNNAFASSIIFNVTNIEYVYELESEILNYTALIRGENKEKSVPLKPNADGILKLRVLVDWSSIEIFSDDGVFSFSQQINFDPNGDNLSLTSLGGQVKLSFLELQTLRSIWN